MEDQKQVYRFFWISVMLKGAISLAEVVTGIAALLIPQSAVIAFVTFLTRDVLAAHPTNFLALHLVAAAQSLTTSLQVFVAFYLLTRGLIKLLLIIALLKNKLWAYPLSLVVLGLFVVYQTYQIFTEHSIIVMLITLFDLVVMTSIWLEYKAVKMGTTMPTVK